MKKHFALATLISLTLGAAGSLQAQTISPSATTVDATGVLFEIIDHSDCVSESLTETIWTIETVTNTIHGELIEEESLQFFKTSVGTSFIPSDTFDIKRGGVDWLSKNGWQGSCVRTPNISLYVITGTVDMNGCEHEIAFGRWSHSDSGLKRIAIAADHSTTGSCTAHSEEEDNQMDHPGEIGKPHSHGFGGDPTTD